MKPIPDRQFTKRAGHAAVGLLTFFVGIVLIAFAFKLAYDLFAIPPDIAVASSESEPLKLDVTVKSLITILVRILLLVVMAGIGSMVATRGIKLYSQPNHSRQSPEKQIEGKGPTPTDHQA